MSPACMATFHSCHTGTLLHMWQPSTTCHTRTLLWHVCHLHIWQSSTVCHTRTLLCRVRARMHAHRVFTKIEDASAPVQKLSSEPHMQMCMIARLPLTTFTMLAAVWSCKCKICTCAICIFLQYPPCHGLEMSELTHLRWKDTHVQHMECTIVPGGWYKISNISRFCSLLPTFSPSLSMLTGLSAQAAHHRGKSLAAADATHCESCVSCPTTY